MKLCYACKHFHFDPGMPGYSEVTPGYEASMRCEKKVWSLTDMDAGGESLAEYLGKAETCEKYKPADWVK